MILYLSVIILAAAACFTDLRWRRIPNLMILAGLSAGFAINTWDGGLRGLGMSFLGAGLGLALFLPFFALGGMGAGDVKLLACLGALLGPFDLLRVAVAAALAGGLLALAAAAWQHRFLATLRGLRNLFSFWISGGLRPAYEWSLENPAALKIPYALPLAVGAWWIVLARWSAP
jgi:prepilin peptidase CpaA